MARRTYGRSLTDWVMNIGLNNEVLVRGGVDITFWSAQSGGVQYMDLLDGAGNPVTSIKSSTGADGLAVGTIPQFQGPDTGITEMWAQPPEGSRYKIVATDIGATVNDMAVRLDNVENLLTNLQALNEHVALAVRYDTAAAAWPARPQVAGARTVTWIGPDASPPPAGSMVEFDEFHGWL